MLLRFVILCFLLTPAMATASLNTILIVGDSLSAGYGLSSADDGWVSLLQQRLQQQGLPYRVVNASITGDTTRGGLARLPQTLQRELPAVVVIELGGNDGLRGFSLDYTRNNIAGMIELSRQSGARVLLLGVQLPVNYGNRYREKFQQIFVDLAEQQQTALVPSFLHGAESLEQMQPDGIHPAAHAQLQLLDNVWPKLLPLLQQDVQQAAQ
ncbi:MAG: arylesterase [Chromatiales bacterium]|jgi:acyl-CoA thioesterase-1